MEVFSSLPMFPLKFQSSFLMSCTLLIKLDKKAHKNTHLTMKRRFTVRDSSCKAEKQVLVGKYEVHDCTGSGRLDICCSNDL